MTTSAILSTAEGELALFRALIHHRPVGTDKHWALIGIELSLRDSLGVSTWLGMGDTEVEDKLKELYDEEVLWAQTQPEAGSDSSTPPPPPTPPTPFSIFRSRDRSISPGETFESQAFERGRRTSKDPASPPSEPVREFPPVPGFGNSPNSRAGGSAKKRKRGDDVRKGSHEADGGESDFSSELTEPDQDDDAEEEKEEASETATASGEEEAAEEEGEEYKEKKPKDKEKEQAQGRTAPASKRQTRQRSRSISVTPQTAASKKEEAEAKEKKEARLAKRRETDRKARSRR